MQMKHLNDKISIVWLRYITKFIFPYIYLYKPKIVWPYACVVRCVKRINGTPFAGWYIDFLKIKIFHYLAEKVHVFNLPSIHRTSCQQYRCEHGHCKTSLIRCNAINVLCHHAYFAKSALWLQMPWLLMTAGHQQPYYLPRYNEFQCSMWWVSTTRIISMSKSNGKHKYSFMIPQRWTR